MLYETPRSFVADSLHERSKHPAIRGGYHFPIIRFASRNTLRKPSKAITLCSGEVEAVKVHYLVPGCDEVVQELPLGILACIDFRLSPQL
jgi:hypothetical protein